MNRSLAAACLLALGAAARASEGGSDASSGVAGQTSETRDHIAEQRARQLDRPGGGLPPDLVKNPKFKKEISGMNDEEFAAALKLAAARKNDGTQMNQHTAAFVLQAGQDRPVGEADLSPFGPTTQRAGIQSMGLRFGAAVTGGSHPQAPPETMIDADVLRAVPPEHAAYPRAQFALAVQDQQRGDHRAALEGFETAIGGGQDDARTLTFASLSALNAGDPRKAADWSALALQREPGGALAEQAEAIAKLALKRLPKEADPLPPPVRRPGEGGGAAPEPGSSIPELDRPLPPRAADPGLPPAAVALLAETNRLVASAAKAYRAGDVKEAVKLAGAALLKDPDDVRALQVRAAALAKAGQWEEARKDAERGLDLAPGYVPLLLLRAAAAAHAKDWRSVRADAQAVINKESANPTAWRFMGIAQAGLGERSEALASLARAVQYGDPEAARLLAAARSLPPGADVVDLVEMLTGAAAAREAASDARAAPPAPAPRRSRTGLVIGAALLAGLVAGGLILLAGRRDEETA